MAAAPMACNNALLSMPTYYPDRDHLYYPDSAVEANGYYSKMPSPDPTLEPVLQSVLSHSLLYLSPGNATPVGASAGLQSLRERLGVPLADGGAGATRVVDDLVAAVEGGL